MKYTIFVSISRENLLEQVADNILRLGFPADKTELIVYVDTNSKEFFDKAEKKVFDITRDKRIYRSVVKMSGEDPLPDDAPIIMRRQRVMSIWNRMKPMVGRTEYFFGFEDDMVIPPDAFKKLMLAVELGAVYAEGVARHRQFNSIGAWKITRKTAMTLPYRETGRDWLDGGGWYCFATRTEFVKRANIREDGAPFGPDVCFVYDLVKRGNKRNLAIVDWGVKCGHIMDGKTLYANENSEQLYFKKVNGNWERDYHAKQ